MGLSNLRRVTTVLIYLIVLSASVADKDKKPHFSQEIDVKSNNIIKGELHTSTTTTVSPKDTTLENPTDTLIETSTTITLSEIKTDTSNVYGFQVIMYVFAIIGLTFSVICLIQICRSSSYCNPSSDDDDDSDYLDERLPKSWRRSWRGKRSRSYAFSDHIIAV